MKIGFIGLGKMGSRMVYKLLEDGHDVMVWNRSKTVIEEFKKGLDEALLKRFSVTPSLSDFIHLEQPRVIWSMLPAGKPTELILEELKNIVEKDDIIIDGGNSHYKDTERRFEEFKNKEIKFLGIGVSGGVIASRNGYPLMIGGNRSAFGYLQPIFETLAKPHGGFIYLGESGAGHFVKMIHNAIEYGMMQSLGEGFGIAEKSEYKLNLLQVAKIWQHGTIISGFLIDRVVDALSKDDHLATTSGSIGMASGETIWTVEQAKKDKLPIEIIDKSLEFRKKSQTDEKVQNSFAAKMVQALRNEFGGHSNEVVALEDIFPEQK